MKIRKNLISVGLSCTLALSLTACGGQKAQDSAQAEVKTEAAASVEAAGGQASDELAWLNTDGTYPVVKDGTEKTLTIYVRQNPSNGNPEDSWVYRYLTDKTKVNLEFTSFYDENRDEFLSLAFASDELPDIIIDARFTTAELIKYGASNGQLLDLSPYINETYMPNLSAIYEEYPHFKDTITAADGKIWSLGYIANPSERGYIERVFLNYDWLDKCGLEVPSTLDEFVDAMRAFKNAGLSKYPLGGSYALANPSNYILNALGYLRVDANAGNICLRNGQTVLPYADREAFGEYLKVMNTMYTEGLIHPDFYTMDSLTTQASLSEGVGFINLQPYLYMSETYNEYWAALPLTSAVNDTAQWTSNTPITFGAAVVTSACDEPELAAKFLDCFYSGEETTYMLCWAGPAKLLTPDDETPDAVADLLYGEEVAKKPDGTWWYKRMIDNKDAYTNNVDYCYKHLNIWGSAKIGLEPWGFIPGNPYSYYGEADWFSFETQDELRAAVAALNSGEKAFRVPMQVEMPPYLTSEVYPNAVYLEESVSNELTNIKIAMDEYAQQEIAKFVTGARALSDEELNNYFDTLEGLGAKDYVKVYADYYESMK